MDVDTGKQMAEAGVVAGTGVTEETGGVSDRTGVNEVTGGISDSTGVTEETGGVSDSTGVTEVKGGEADNTGVTEVKGGVADNIGVPEEVDEVAESADVTEGNTKGPCDQEDVYDYTQGQLFTSEIYKIEIQNLPKHFGFKQLKKMITNMNLKPKKVKAVNRATYAFVTFTCEEDRQEALRVLNGHTWKNLVLRAKPAKPKADPMAAKRKQEQDDDNDEGAAKRSKQQDTLTPQERLCNAVIPYWNKPYEEQLKLKEESMKQFMITLGRTYERQIPEVKPWLSTQRLKHNNLCCELESIIPAAAVNEYRNKCEFSIGRSTERQDNTVGFRFGRYKGGTTDVLEPTCCCNVPSSMKKVAAAFQEHIRSTGLASHQPQTHRGYWQMLVVRTTLENQTMVIAHLHQQKLSEEEISKQKRDLRDFFVEGDGMSCCVTSLYIQLHKDRESLPLEHLWGEKCIYERMMGLQFRISPEAFFQVNTKAAEVLYKTIADWCGATKQTTVLDVCCGTGTIGISIAKNVHRVIGVEMNQQATHDAKENAKLNGIDNIEFHCGKAEDVMPKLTNGLEHCRDIVAIVDPPRPGLHKKVIEAIRRCAYLEKLVYVSCNANNAIGNFVDLCRRISIKSKGVPFRPVKAVPVDLFPHTRHCELLILFERDLGKAGVKKSDQVDPQMQDHGPETSQDGGGNETSGEGVTEATPAGVEQESATSMDEEASEATPAGVEQESATSMDDEAAKATPAGVEQESATSMDDEAAEATPAGVEQESATSMDDEAAEATPAGVEQERATSVDEEASISSQPGQPTDT